MDTSSPVYCGLLRKRQEIADELDALDVTIRLFDPGFDEPTFRVHPAPRRHKASRGDSSRLILSILREAGELVSHRDITVRVMTARGLNLADRGLCQTIRNRVGASLWGLRQRGSVVSGEGRDVGMRWGLAHHATDQQE